MKSDHFEQTWQGRVDPEDGLAGLRVHQVVEPFSPQSNNGITLLGLASDLGVQHNQGRVGAEHGPTALRSALANLAWHFDTPLYDAGDIKVNSRETNDPLANAQDHYAALGSDALSRSQHVIGLGGGHEIAWASYQACRRFLDQQNQSNARLGILNFDAHFDLRKTPAEAAWAGSSGTPFRQIWLDSEARSHNFDYACIGVNQSANTAALFEFANQHGVQYILDEHCANADINAWIDAFVRDLDALYVTICLDVLPAYVAPGVSAPAALGIPLSCLLQGIESVQAACEQHQVSWLMSDIAELNPTHDIDQRTARVAARLIYRLIQAQCA